MDNEIVNIVVVDDQHQVISCNNVVKLPLMVLDKDNNMTEKYGPGDRAWHIPLHDGPVGQVDLAKVFVQLIYNLYWKIWNFASWASENSLLYHALGDNDKAASMLYVFTRL